MMAWFPFLHPNNNEFVNKGIVGSVGSNGLIDAESEANSPIVNPYKVDDIYDFQRGVETPDADPDFLRLLIPHQNGDKSRNAVCP